MSVPATASSSNFSHLSQKAVEELKASVFKRLHPKVYLEKYLDENVRPDGRGVNEWRNVEVNVAKSIGSISTADGSALVRMGNTTVVCGVKAEIAEPELDREAEGFLVPNIDLPAMCSPKFKPGPPSDEAQVLSHRLNEVLVASEILPLTTLCIQRGKAAWAIYLDVTCINYDGNAFDATLLAMVAALRNTTLPRAIYNDDTNRTICSRKAPRVALELSTSIPVSMSFGIFDSRVILADATSFEEPLLDSGLTVVLSNGNKIVTLSQFGTALITCAEEDNEDEDLGVHRVDGLRREVLPDCIERAKRRRDELLVLLQRT